MITGIDYVALTDLQKNGLFTDVTVITPGSTPSNYPLHKVILASSSKYFAEILTKNPAIDKIKLPNPAVPESSRGGSMDHIYIVLFKSLYTQMSLSDFISDGLGVENCFSYFSLADSLKLESAKKIIQDYISSNVANTSNSSSLLLDATKLQVPDLISRCSNLLLQDFSRTLSNREQTDKILRLPYDSFLKLVREDNMVVESEDAVFDLVIKYIELRDNLDKKPEGEKFFHRDPGSKPKPAEPAPTDPAPPVEVPPPVAPPIAEPGTAPEAPAPPPVAPPVKPEGGDPAPPVAGDTPPPPVDAPPVADKPPAPPLAAPELPVIDAAALAEQLIRMFPLTDEQKKELLLSLRFKFISHEKIMKESKSATLQKFKDILLEGLSAKLKNFEPNSLTVSINLNPRSHYTSPLSASMIGNALTAPGGMLDAHRKSGATIPIDTRMHKPQSHPAQGVPGSGSAGPAAHRGAGANRESELPMGFPVRTNDGLHAHPNQLNGGGRPPHMMTGPHGLPLMASSSTGHPSAGFNVFEHFDSKFKQNGGTGFTGSNMPQHNNTLSREGLPLAYSQADGYTSSEYYSSPEHGTQDGELVFNFKYDFDENGALYYLGTRGKTVDYHNPYALSLVKVFFSSMGRGSYEDFVGRSLVNCRTLNEPGAFMGIDFGADRSLIPTYYTIRNRDSSKHIMLNWVFEGSVDFKTWYILDKRILKSDDPSYNKIMEKERLMVERKAATSTWSVDQNYLKLASRSVAMHARNFHGFRFFRLKQISKNSSGADNLALSGIEIYGIARGQGWHII